MARFLWAFALTFVIVGAPVATVVCHVTCETHRAHDIDNAGGHAHHSCVSTPATAAANVNAAPLDCGHSPGDSIGVRQSVHVLDAPTAVAVQVSLRLPVRLIVLATPTRHVEHSPPGTFDLVTPLRV
jgi:hypothetical protein